MHINKLTGLHRDNVAKKAVPVSQTKTCQNDLPCRSTRHPPVSMIFSHGRSQVTWEIDIKSRPSRAAGLSFRKLRILENEFGVGNSCKIGNSVQSWRPPDLSSQGVNDTGTDVRAVKSGRAYQIPSTAKQASYLGGTASFNGFKWPMTNWTKDIRYKLPSSWSLPAARSAEVLSAVRICHKHRTASGRTRCPRSSQQRSNYPMRNGHLIEVK